MFYVSGRFDRAAEEEYKQLGLLILLKKGF